MKDLVNKEVEKIFNVFNERYFKDKLPMPLFKFGRGKYPRINTNVVAKNKDKYSHEITLPYYCLNDDIDELAAKILEGMIQEYSFINDAKLFSRACTYYNKHFAKLAESFGLSSEYSKEKRGFIILSNATFKQMCMDSGFKKTWGKIYEYNRGLKDGSTVKYYDPDTGNSIRATKEHFLICFDECPEIGEQVEKLFNKKRMILED